MNCCAEILLPATSPPCLSVHVRLYEASYEGEGEVVCDSHENLAHNLPLGWL